MKRSLLILSLLSALLVLKADSCNETGSEPVSSSGVSKASTDVQKGPDGLTSEQRNIIGRYKMDNVPGAIKHLYVISAYTGDVIIYSTVREKVTSSGKRLSPATVIGTQPTFRGTEGMGFLVDFSRNMKRTEEAIQDDGTYGSSIEYLYWWDQQGRYHQHYAAGGQIIHVSDQPLRVGRVILNLELADNE